MMNSQMVGFILISGVMLSTHAFAFAPPSIDSNNEGVEKYKAEEYGQAFKLFADSVAKDSFNGTFHYNLGNAFYRQGELPKALAEYDSAEKLAKDNETKFQAMFNAGVVALESKDVAKALQYYQKALEYKPDSIETKTNIELALKENQNQGGGGNNDDKDQKDKKDQNKGGQSKDDKDDKDGDKKKDQKQDQGNQPKPKPTAQPFKSKNLNESDVKRILEELKKREQEIRSKERKDNKKHAPEAPVEKDW